MLRESMIQMHHGCEVGLSYFGLKPCNSYLCYLLLLKLIYFIRSVRGHASLDRERFVHQMYLRTLSYGPVFL